MSQNDKAGRVADYGAFRTSAQMKAMALHSRKALVRYQDLVMRLRAYMLLIVKKALEIFGAPDPEAAFENKGGTHVFFEGLPPERQGEEEKLRRRAHYGARDFFKASSKTRAAMDDFLKNLVFTNGAPDGHQGSTWLELGILFEIRTGVAMPRRWPPEVWPREHIAGRNAAIDTHATAFNA